MMPTWCHTARPGARFAHRFVLAVAALLGPVPLLAAAGSAQTTTTAGAVLVTTVDGTITPVMARHLAGAIDRAERDAAQLLVVELDTPGGLESSMRDMVQDILASPVPVAVYVAPAGARAASAGAIVTFAAHVAAMAPGTAIGASTPVDLEGGDVARKVVNDATAFAESIARLRGRNVAFAADAVREGRSASAAEAVELDVVDLEVPTLAALLQELDGRTVVVSPGDRPVVLRSAGAAVVRDEMGLFERVQQWLADPNLAYLFLSLGTMAIVLELASPGVGAGGIAGAVLLLLAMFSLAVLPVNVVGLLLVALAAGLFVVELFVPGVGVAAAGGAVALGLSGLFLVRDVPGFEVSAAVLVPVAVLAGVAALVAGRVARTVRGAPARTGVGLFEGRVVRVDRTEGATGWAFLEGAWWRVRERGGGELPAGTQVRVVEVDGLELVVETTATDEAPLEERR
jgi:membrane-bound serine protease (ClpP class)